MQEIHFFIFRHGETDWNAQKLFQGHTDIPLNANGVQQAHTLRPVFQALNIDRMMSSDLQRALVTAELVNQPKVAPVKVSSNLRECSLGEAEGLHRDIVIEKYGPALIEKWRDCTEATLDFGFPGGETKRQHLARLLLELKSQSLQHPEIQRWGVSTHGGSLMRLVHHCEDAPQETIQIQNCSLYEITWEPKKERWHFCQRHH